MKEAKKNNKNTKVKKEKTTKVKEKECVCEPEHKYDCGCDCKDCKCGWGISFKLGYKSCGCCCKKSMLDCFIDVVKRYSTAKGRLSRHDFWSFFLIYVIFSCLVSLFGSILGSIEFVLIFQALTLLPFLGAIVRRLHDVGRSMIWIVLPIILPIYVISINQNILSFTENARLPLLSANLMISYIDIAFVFILFFLLICKGDCKANKYGEIEE